jgi:hypothetical protein
MKENGCLVSDMGQACGMAPREIAMLENGSTAKLMASGSTPGSTAIAIRDNSNKA